MLIVPEETARHRIECPNVAVETREEHHTVDDERRALHGERPGGGDETDGAALEDPRRP